ncbi:MAG: hypothetical protein NC411_09010 [Bacteroides sp.]|nr:hypothetical protein [Bacteroides sp.]
MFCLKGPVDSICIVMNDAGLEWQTEFTFDENGFLIELDGAEIDCVRDENGRMKSITVEDALEDDEDAFTTINMTMAYDSEGRVIKVTSTSADETWTQNYRYNKDGLLSERDYDSDNQDEVQKYVYLKFDNFGNWTQRQEKLQSMDQVITQTRNITYRK